MIEAFDRAALAEVQRLALRQAFGNIEQHNVAELLARCDHVIRIPTNFSLNVATAGAIVMYDRLRALGRFAPRPISEGTEAPELAPHIRGEPRRRSQRARQG